jgi:hypothetical protein
MSNQQYLQRKHNTWTVVVDVPKALRKAVGAVRLKHSLKTPSLAEANRLKHPVVTEFKRQIEVARLRQEDPTAAVLRDGKEWRAELATASKAEDERGASIYGELLDQVKELSRQLAEKDEALAEAFHQTATGEGTLLKDLYSQRASSSDGCGNGR